MEKRFRDELALVISATSNCVIKLVKRIRSVHEGGNALSFRLPLFITSSSCTERKEKTGNSVGLLRVGYLVDKGLKQKKRKPLFGSQIHTSANNTTHIL